MDERQLRAFLADFDYRLGVIRSIYRRLEAKSVLMKEGGATPEVVESVGYWLHNLYSAYEDLFKITAAFWENGVTSNGGYHVSLLQRMCVAVEGVRPALLSEGSYRQVDELRGFRHVFRHAYSYGLDEERVQHLLGKVLGAKNEVLADIEKFRTEVARLLGT